MRREEDTRIHEEGGTSAETGVFRFCVGAAAKPRSSVWKIYVRKNDIYIFSRGLGSDLKVSIHASGSAHWSVSAEWFLKRGLEFQNQDRHVVRWDRSNPEPTKAAHIFRIILPASKLRLHCAVPVEKRITWLPEPRPRTAYEVEMYLTPPRSSVPCTETSPYSQLALLETRSARWVAILAHQEELTPEKTKALIDARNETKKLVPAAVPRSGKLRAIGFLQSPDNPPGLIELVL